MVRKRFVGSMGRRRGKLSRHFVGVSVSIRPPWLMGGVQGAPFELCSEKSV